VSIAECGIYVGPAIRSQSRASQFLELITSLYQFSQHSSDLLSGRTSPTVGMPVAHIRDVLRIIFRGVIDHEEIRFGFARRRFAIRLHRSKLAIRGCKCEERSGQTLAKQL